MSAPEFALFGAPPAFAEPLFVGQRYFPSWNRYCQALRGIFKRQYYTEYGPLNQQFEQNLQHFLGVNHAICVTNETVGLLMAADAMSLSGRVLLPRNAFPASTQSLLWADLNPVYYDIDVDSNQLDIDRLIPLIDGSVSAIMGIHLWGGACDTNALAELATAYRIQLYYDATHAFGCRVNGIHIGNFGRCEVFSFHQDNILNATEGGCICTNDDELAARLRTMRSSSGIDAPVSVIKTVNGRMSEAQAGIALMNLEDFPANRRNNQALHRVYETQLESLPGLRLLRPRGGSHSNFQCVVCRIDGLEYGLPRNTLTALLNAENVCTGQELEYRQPSKNAGAPNTYYIQLPIGAGVTTPDVKGICAVLANAHRQASKIRAIQHAGIL